MQSGTDVASLELASQTDSSANITFVDERPMDVVGLHTTTDVYSRDIFANIAENDWSITKVLERLCPISSFEWKVSDSGILFSGGLPALITKEARCMITRQLQFFAFLRAGIRIRVQLNGTKFHCGRVIVFFKPLTWSDDKEQNFHSVTCYPHFFLDASQSNSGEIEIPFTHLYSYFAQEAKSTFNSSTNALGSLIIRVYNPLQAATDSSQVLNGQVYLSLIEPFVHLPTSGIVDWAYGTGEVQGVEALAKRAMGSIVDTGFSLADKFTGGLVTGIGNAITNMLGIQDKPLDPVSATPIINRAVAPLCHGAGLDRSTRLGLSPTSQTNTVPEILGATDGDFNILTLCKIPCLWDQLDWYTTMLPGTEIGKFGVSPVYLSPTQYSRDPVGRFTNYSPTMLAYISRAFCLWRGTLKVKIQVVGTQFHSGRLALVYDPHASGTTTFDGFEGDKSHNIIIVDIQEQKEIVIELPYFSMKPWLRCDHFRSDLNLNKEMTNPAYIDCDMSGVFRIYVLNTLVRPSNLTDKLRVNVFVYAGDNFELAVPNPVSPLSVRPGPSGVQYENQPRYAYCFEGKNQLCDLTMQVDTLYNAGKLLFNDKQFVAGKVWYDPGPIMIVTDDSLTFSYECKKLQYYLEGRSDVCSQYIKSLPPYEAEEETMQMQGIESFTTNRDNEGDVVNIIDANNTASVAPLTVSENAMNLQTILRRYYPLWVSGDLNHHVGFTVIAIPVSPSMVPYNNDVNISSGINRRNTVHNLAWFSRIYTFNRGSLRYKVLFNSENADVYVWHNPVDTKQFTVVSSVDYDHVVEQLNFASEVAMSRVQQGIEVEVPFYSSFNQLLHSHVSNKKDLRAENGVLYVAVRNSSDKPLNISLFISTGDDFFLNVLRSPPILHEPWTAAYTNGTEFIDSPEFQQSMGHSSGNVQLPGTYVFDAYQKGAFGDCDIPARVFESTQLVKNSQQMEMQGLFHSLKEATGNIEPLIKESYLTLQELRELIETSKASIGEMGTISTKINTFIDESQDIAKNVLSKTDGLLDQVANMEKGVSSLLDGATDVSHYFIWMCKTVLVSNICLNVRDLFTEFKWVTLMNVICSFGALFHVEAIQVIKWVYENASELCEGYRPKANNGEMDIQGLESFIKENNEGSIIVLSVLATVLYCALFGQLPCVKKIKECLHHTIVGKTQSGSISDFMRSVHFNNLGCKAMANSYEFFHTWITKLLNWFIGQEGKEILLQKEFNEQATEIEKWLDDIEALEDEDFAFLALTDIDIHNKFYKLADQGKEFVKLLLRDGMPRTVSMIIRDANKKLFDMIKRINEIRPGHGFRYSPFVVMLDGPSGVAKSNVMHKFTDMVRKELGVPMYNSVCTVPKTKEFLDGYTGQAIVEWDDMLQCPKQDEMVAEFINWRSNADCIINKAKVDEKGMHFVSKAIITSTNNGDININTIRDMAALRNRINVKFDCYLAPGFTSGSLKELDYDPTFPFLRMNMLEADSAGASYKIVGRDLTLAEALAQATIKFQKWNLKQNSLVSDYMVQHGSLRIPRGVVVEESESFTDCVEMQSLEYKVLYSKNLTREEELDAELFNIQFLELSPEEKKRYVTHKRSSNKRFWLILKEKLQLAKSAFLKIVQDFYAKYPKFVIVSGAISMFAAALIMLKTLGRGGVVGESYDSVPAKSAKVLTVEHYEDVAAKPTKVVIAEHYDTVPKNSHPVLVAESQSLQLEVLGVENNKSELQMTKAQFLAVKKIIFTKDQSLAETKRKLKAYGFNGFSAPISIQQQGCDDPEAIVMARGKIHPLLSVVSWLDGSHSLTLQCVAIGGKVILAPHHFFMYAQNGDKFFFFRGTHKIIIEYQSNRLFRIRDKDACLYYMGAQFDSRKSIASCFVEESQLSKLGRSTSVVLIGTTPSGILMEKAGIAKSNVHMKYSNSDDTITYAQYGWSYNMNTVKGECGSLLIACSKVLPPPGKIIGMHTAGYSDKIGGFSVVISKEMILETVAKLTAIHGAQVYSAGIPIQVSQDEKLFNDTVKVRPEGAFSLIGTMDSKLCPSQPQKSHILKTPFYEEEYISVKMPAQLQSVEGVSPLRKAINKYGKLTTPFQARHIEMVKKDILNDLLQFDTDMSMERCSDKIAILGIEGIDYCDRMNMASSPGWPYQCMPGNIGKKGKEYLFDLDKGTISDPLLQKNYTLRETMALQGERVPSIWRDCMKDELRPIEKVKECKTRVFTIPPVDFTILVRKYFFQFEQMFYKNHGKFFSSVGINPESYEWTHMYNRLREYGDKCVAGDFGTYDGTLMADCMKATVDIINEWYAFKIPEENYSQVRDVLMDEMIHTYQLVQNCVYKTHQGNPSGNALTVIINTIVNAMYMRLSWLEITQEHRPLLSNMYSFKENVRDEIYGDDNRLVIKSKVIDIFNQNTISENLYTHGLEYTDEFKSKGVLAPYKPLLSTSFLKRRYIFNPDVGKDIALPQMDVDTITSLTNWYRDAPDVEEQLQANQRAALDFAFFHGKTFYDKFSTQFSHMMLRHNFCPIQITYAEQLERFLCLLHGHDSITKFVNVGF